MINKRYVALVISIFLLISTVLLLKYTGVDIHWSLIPISIWLGILSVEVEHGN